MTENFTIKRFARLGTIFALLLKVEVEIENKTKIMTAKY